MIKLEGVIEGLELECEECNYYYHVASDSIIMLTNIFLRNKNSKIYIY